jgi:hypothetical protein
MTRERFETDQDRANQRELMLDLNRTLNWTFHDLSKSNAHYNLDYFTSGPEWAGICAAWVEVKVRTHKFGTFKTIMLSAGKWIEGARAARDTGLPFLLFFRFTDGVYQYGYSPKHVASPVAVTTGLTSHLVKFEWGGRTVKERDEADSEPVALIPLWMWERVEIPPSPEREKAPFERHTPPAPLAATCTCFDGCKSATCDKL